MEAQIKGTANAMETTETLEKEEVTTAMEIEDTEATESETAAKDMEDETKRAVQALCNELEDPAPEILMEDQDSKDKSVMEVVTEEDVQPLENTKASKLQMRRFEAGDTLEASKLHEDTLEPGNMEAVDLLESQISGMYVLILSERNIF